MVAQRGQVLGAAIPLVAVKTVVWVSLRGFNHQAIPGHFCQDRCSRYRRGQRIPANKRTLFNRANFRKRVSVDQDQVRTELV